MFVNEFCITADEVEGEVFVHQWGANGNMEACYNGPESEAYEKLMSLQTHTVPSPGAVVVHPHHTLLADAAVVGSWWFQVVALLAKPQPKERIVLLVHR